MTGLTVVISAVICLVTYRKTTRESAAALLRPKAPKDGRKLLLERITPLWRRLDFNGKMVFRNLARSKMRTLMSTVGLICCNALLIASMGLQDSVQQTIDTHYTKTVGYNVAVSLNSQAGDAAAYKTHLDAEAVECVMESSLRLTTLDGEKTTALTVVEDGQQLLRLGPGGVYVPLADGGMAVTEKVAQQLHLQVGDTVSCQLAGDDERFTLAVNQIVENNLSQGVYLTRTTWESLRKGAFTPTALYLLNPSQTCLSILQDSPEVDEIDTTENQAQEALIFLNTISVIFVILMVIALLMAFVICYNMGLINFAERTREYATLKVLGYHRKGDTPADSAGEHADHPGGHCHLHCAGHRLHRRDSHPGGVGEPVLCGARNPAKHCAQQRDHGAILHGDPAAADPQGALHRHGGGAEVRGIKHMEICYLGKE